MTMAPPDRSGPESAPGGAPPASPPPAEAPPDRSGPESAPGGPQPSSRPRAEDRLTRKRLPLWDRIKLLLMLGILWLVLVWTGVANGGPQKFDSLFADAWRPEVRNARGLIVLIALEVLRQIHFLVSEHWAGYN